MSGVAVPRSSRARKNKANVGASAEPNESNDQMPMTMDRIQVRLRVSANFPAGTTKRSAAIDGADRRMPVCSSLIPNSSLSALSEPAKTVFSARSTSPTPPSMMALVHPNGAAFLRLIRRGPLPGKASISTSKSLTMVAPTDSGAS